MASSTSKSNFTKYIKWAIISCIPLYFVTYCLMIGGFIPTREAVLVSRRDYVFNAKRRIDDFSRKYHETHGCIYPCKEYYGPLTREMLSELSGTSPSETDMKNTTSLFYWSIDPFNAEGPEDTLLCGPLFGDTRGAIQRIKGHDFYYYTDGHIYYIIGSYGPDRDQDLFPEEVIANYSGPSPSRLEAYNFDYYLKSNKYDVSNGTFSDGDIMSIDILPLDRWRKSDDGTTNNH